MPLSGRLDAYNPLLKHSLQSTAEAIRLLLREMFTAAGGTHDDWDTYDRTMAEDRRAAVLITPRRIYTSPG